MDFQKLILKELKKHSKNPTLEVPPDPKLGDYAFPCFELAKIKKKSPIDIASQLSKIKIKNVDVKQTGPYLNFFIDKKEFIKQAINQIKKYKPINIGKKQKVMIEYSQANTHKAFHIGHVRGTTLGESLSRILEHTNHKVIRANYQGDTGAHVAKWIWYFKKNKLKIPKKNIEQFIANTYVSSVKKLDDNEDLQEEVDIINKKIEQRDASIDTLWKKTKKLSLDEFEKIYKILDTKFNLYFFESEMEKPAKKIVTEMLKKNLATIEDGAALIKFKKLGVWILLRKDGTVLYSAKDLALANIKFNKHKIKKNIYVVGAAQSLHFQQLFKTLNLLNFKTPSFQLPYNEVRLPGKKMSSRTGDNILFTELYNSLLEKSIKETKKRNKKLSKKEIEKISAALTTSAIKFPMLAQDPNKPITFNPEESLSFEGDTGPYIQYTLARLHSILSKQKPKPGKINIDSEEELALAKKLTLFSSILEKTTQELKPNLLANYLLELSRATNEFYHKHPVLKSTKSNSRLHLIDATKTVLTTGLTLLSITPLKSM